MNSKFHYTIFSFLLLLLLITAGVNFLGLSVWLYLPAVLVLLLFLFLGSSIISWNFYFPSLNQLQASEECTGTGAETKKGRPKIVALTFDDGPHYNSRRILQILEEHQVPATFFLIGKKVCEHPDIVAEMHQKGHSIGNHSYYHGPLFDLQSSKNMGIEIDKANEVISQITKAPTTLFRPPYGVTNPNLRRAIQKTGMISIGWNLRSMDTVAKNKEKLLEKIIRKTKPGSIILLHDTCTITAEILPDLIATLKGRGYEFVRIE